ncbi:cyclic nucleotide-binding domain-containing protein [Rhodoferax sp. GW822-FHT02A01]|uniref:Crp/Fnr family transcriptional regulator n=1 Tax=Rhodoferax sp. GW822-FHT02A01 TaxID=3141537 RepID=UPI00315DEB04
MATRIAPEIAHLFSDKIGVRKYYAEPIPPTPSLPTIRLDPKIVKKIADGVAIFAKMQNDDLLATLAIGEVRPFNAGEVLFREDEVGDSFYVIVVGSVNVLKIRESKSHVVASLGVGECFGEMALILDEIRTATVVANVDCVTLCFQRARFEAFHDISLIIYKNIAHVLARRLNERSNSLSDLLLVSRFNVESDGIVKS